MDQAIATNEMVFAKIAEHISEAANISSEKITPG